MQRTRERALAVTLRWMTLGLIPIWIVLIAQALSQDALLPVVGWLVVMSTPLPLLYLVRSRLGHERTSILLVASLFVIVLFLEVLGGFTPGAALISNSLLLLSSLLFGKRAMRWILAACLGNLALGWLLYPSAFVDHDVWRLYDPSNPLVWLRYALVLLFLGGALRDTFNDVRGLEQEKLLNELGAILASSLNVQQTLGEVSRRVSEHLADLSVVDVLDGKPMRLHVTVRDPKRAWLGTALRHVVLDYGGPHLAEAAWRTHQPQMVQVTDEFLRSHSQGPEHLALLRALHARSIVSAPMITRGHMLGVLIAVSSTRPYDQQDLQLLSQIAQRAAMAVENAALHGALRDAHANLRSQFAELRESQAKVRTLTGLLPICAWCGRIRDDHHAGAWKDFEQYVMDNTSADFTHSICPECASRCLCGNRDRPQAARRSEPHE
ncbi:MAG: GAF domain-containing protein [Myxococcales bacterium]